jgi:hypothetical protein
MEITNKYWCSFICISASLLFFFLSLKMDQLPSDILNHIFIQLPFSQKKECLLVCRLWENIVKNQCLFHTLEIGDEGRYQEFMNMMIQTPSFRTQVVDLAILVYWQSQNIKNVIEYFPNLEQFSFTRRASEEPEYTDSQMTRSASRMRYIRDVDSCALLRALVKAGLCSRLKEISVTYFDCDLVLPILNNMPALKHLSLERRYITIAQLETLHKDLPTLEFLGVGLKFEDEEDSNNDIPKHITPAASISTLFIDMENVIEDDQTAWLLYASKKYPNLKHYSLSIETTCYDEVGEEAFRNMYSTSYTPFLKTLGPQLLSMHLPGAQFSNFEIFQKMDEYGCQIKTITLDSDQENTWCLPLSQSNQARYIQDLSIYDVRPCSFDWLKSIKALRRLRMNFTSDDFKGNQEIDINAAFKSCSKTVKSVTFNYANYGLNGEFDETFQIEELQLNSGRTPANIGRFIAECLPNLHILYLNGSMVSVSNLILPNHHFSYVRLLPHAGPVHGNFALTTMKNPGRYLFKTKNKSTHVHMSHYDKFIKPIPEDGFNGEPFIDLVFGSVRKLIINNCQVLLN